MGNHPAFEIGVDVHWMLSTLLDAERARGDRLEGAIRGLLDRPASRPPEIIEPELSGKGGYPWADVERLEARIEALTGRLATADSLIGTLRAEVEALTAQAASLEALK